MDIQADRRTDGVTTCCYVHVQYSRFRAAAFHIYRFLFVSLSVFRQRSTTHVHHSIDKKNKRRDEVGGDEVCDTISYTGMTMIKLCFVFCGMCNVTCDTYNDRQDSSSISCYVFDFQLIHYVDVVGQLDFFLVKVTIEHTHTTKHNSIVLTPIGTCLCIPCLGSSYPHIDTFLNKQVYYLLLTSPMTN